MKAQRYSFTIWVATALLFSAAQQPSLAGSANWATNPTSGDWNTAANWIPNTVPNSPSDIASFGASNVTGLSITNASVELDSAVFNGGAPPYTITIQIYNLTLSGAGIINDSGSMQSIVAPTVDNNGVGIFFYNSAAAGNMTRFSTVGGLIEFFDTSSAGRATFDLADSSLQASMDFFDSSTASDCTISASTDANVGFFNSSSGGNASITVTDESFLNFGDEASADHATGTCKDGDQYFGTSINFQQSSSAGEGTFTAIGASTSGDKGSVIEFTSSATADNATFVVGGGLGAGLAATALTFYDTTTAAAANITANGGADGSDGGAISFQKNSDGDTCTITLSGNAELDISSHNAPGVTIGSLAGAGSVLLGANALTLGGNNLSTTFSGAIQDGSNGTGGSLSKVGTGTLTLSGANTYIGSTTLSAGAL